MKKTTISLLLLAMLAMPAAGFAASPWAEETEYGDKISEKLQFGLKNTLLGWTDIFFEPIRASKKCDSCDSIWTGLGKGLTDAIVNEVGGAFHLLTFPLPVDVPLPEDGVQFATCCGCGASGK
jgi:hypothetical protein